METWFATSYAKGIIMDLGSCQNYGDSYDSSSTRGQMVYLDSSGHVCYGTYLATSPTVICTPATYATGAWHHLVVTYSGGTKIIYLDGAKVATASGQPNQTISGYWRVGDDSASGWSGVGGSSPSYNGYLQWASLYPTVLTAAQVADHYKAGI